MQPPTPTCVGIIMDGNRRFARASGLSSYEGHRQGYEKMKEVLGWCKDVGVRHVVVYALSTENWQRAPEEVAYLMDLFRVVVRDFDHKQETDAPQDVAVHFVGDLSRFPADIHESMDRIHADNSADASYHLWIAASYGGRAEIISVVQGLVASGVPEVTEEMFSAALWTAGMPDPDLIIRTGGEQRLSNFLPWQSVYSELFFTQTQWPAFTKEEFSSILEVYGSRERRHGR